eukprot:12621836-Heterocapsa_arctica.AAC.1
MTSIGRGLQVLPVIMSCSVLTMCSSPAACLPSQSPGIHRASSFGRSNASERRTYTGAPKGSTGWWYER